MKKTISNTPQSTTLSGGVDLNNVITSLQSTTNSLSANLITVNSILQGDQSEIDALENQLNNYALLGSGTNNYTNQNVFFRRLNSFKYNTMREKKKGNNL